MTNIYFERLLYCYSSTLRYFLKPGYPAWGPMCQRPLSGLVQVFTPFKERILSSQWNICWTCSTPFPSRYISGPFTHVKLYLSRMEPGMGRDGGRHQVGVGGRKWGAFVVQLQDPQRPRPGLLVRMPCKFSEDTHFKF